MINFKSITLKDKNKQSISDIIQKHLGKSIEIPNHQVPLCLNIFINPFIKQKWVSIICWQNKKMKFNQKIAYEFEVEYD